jgi:hypothetical protein
MYTNIEDSKLRKKFKKQTSGSERHYLSFAR